MTNGASLTNCYVFRINYDEAHEWVLSEMENKSVLRQGWGRTGLAILTDDGSPIPYETWVSNYPLDWKDDHARQRALYDLLLRMQPIEKNNLLIIPKTKDNYTFGICRATGRYRFDSRSKTMWDDFRHVIPIEGLKHFRYDANVEAKLISSKFRSYQCPVNNVWNLATKNAIHNIWKMDADVSSKSMMHIWREILKKATAPAKRDILNIDPISFENLLAACLSSKGYVIVRKNEYDGQGSDIDIRAYYCPPFIGEFLDTEVTFLIQVKKKRGHDSDFKHGVDQLRLARRENPNAHLILMNSTDELTNDEQKYAFENEVKVIHGADLIELILTSDLTR